MSTDYLVLIELLLIFGGIMWFGFSQLRSLKKMRRSDAEKDDKKAQDRERQ